MAELEKHPRIVLLGASGRMGRTITSRFLTDGKVLLTGAVDPDRAGENVGTVADAGVQGPEIVKSVKDLPMDLLADIALDFSLADGTRDNISDCLERGWDVIIGATGFSPEDHDNFRGLTERYSRRIVLVPNFTPGINLLLKFAQIASKIFPNVEIIELHHDRKADAPSGTALHTAKLIASSRDKGVPNQPPNTGDRSRGKITHNIPIHSVRMQGLLAHQEVLFGSDGETLTIRHDTTDRSAFLSGIYLAIENLHELEPGFRIGLDWAFD